MKLSHKPQMKSRPLTVVVWKKDSSCQGRIPAAANWLKASRARENLIWFRPEDKN